MSWFKNADISNELHPNLTLTPEYQELQKLVKILMQTGQVPPTIVSDELQGRSLESPADVVDLQERLFKDAIEIYKIPKEFLVEKLWGKRTLKNIQ